MSSALLINILTLFLLFLFSPSFIKILKEKGFYKKIQIKDSAIKKSRNKLFYGKMSRNISTPSSYGILLIFVFLFNTIYLLIPKEFAFVTIIPILGFITLGLLGFIDDLFEFFFYNKFKRWGIRARYKLLIQTLVFFIVYYISTSSIYPSIFFSLSSTFILNSYNITDGLDGLVGGLSLLIFPVLYLLEYSYYNSDLFILIITIAFLFTLIFFFYNRNPAKVFLGDSGSYFLGALLGFLLFRYPLYLTLPLYSVFLLEGSSSLLQIISLKLFNRKIFSIAPLHLHLLNKGYSKKFVVRTAWLVQLGVSILISITFLICK
jgi:phospho-N-acetylmuramoyl-pentapeptide-transferase